MDTSPRENRWNIVTKNGYYTLENGFIEEREFGKETARVEINTDSDVYYPVFVLKTLRQYLSGERPIAGLLEMLAVRRVLDRMNELGQPG